MRKIEEMASSLLNEMYARIKDDLMSIDDNGVEDECPVRGMEMALSAIAVELHEREIWLPSGRVNSVSMQKRWLQCMPIGWILSTSNRINSFYRGD